MKLKNRIFAALMCIVLIAIPACLPISAVSSFNKDQEASLSISFTDGETPIADTRFSLYQVGVPIANEYVLADDFADIPVSLDNLSSEGLQLLADTLTVYIDAMSIKPLASEVTDADGNISFTNLELGMYLIIGEEHTQDGCTYSQKPFIISLPTLNETNDTWEYDLTVTPKFDKTPENPDKDDFVERKVLKVWDDNGNDEKRPQSIVVHLMCDGKVYDTVTLSAEINWRYAWKELDSDHSWTVVEEVPEGYTVSITLEGITYVVTNSSPTQQPTLPDNPTNLPQTGQLWWPVPVLVVAGMFLIIIGYLRSRGTNNEM